MLQASLIKNDANDDDDDDDDEGDGDGDDDDDDDDDDNDDDDEDDSDGDGDGDDDDDDDGDDDGGGGGGDGGGDDDDDNLILTNVEQLFQHSGGRETCSSVSLQQLSYIFETANRQRHYLPEDAHFFVISSVVDFYVDSNTDCHYNRRNSCRQTSIIYQFRTDLSETEKK